jgi:hypothetical protein
MTGDGHGGSSPVGPAASPVSSPREEEREQIPLGWTNGGPNSQRGRSLKLLGGQRVIAFQGNEFGLARQGFAAFLPP